MRIHDDGSIPEDNPFFDDLEGDQRMIWAYGLRNPYNMAYYLEANKIYVSDVGAGDYEEINELHRELIMVGH